MHREAPLPAATWQAHTPQQAAAILHVPVSQIYAAVKRGELDAARVGKHIRISDSSLRRFAGQSHGPDASPDDARRAAYIRALVDDMPPLTPEQIARLRVLLRPQSTDTAPAMPDAA